MNYNFKKELPSFIILAIAWVAGWYFYQHFPAQVVTHWNFYGQPDAWGGKTANAWMFPGILTAMYILFSILPNFDPRKDRYPEFGKVYSLFKNIFLLVMLIVMLAAGLYNLGYNVQIQYVVPTVIGLLMIVIGNYMGKIKPNWFMGIRTPWTLSSENVWNKTHRVGGYAFIVFGLILIVVPFLPAALGLTAFVAGILIVTFGTFVYSYLVYRQERTAIR
jgi:uncharacterized membrane protein